MRTLFMAALAAALVAAPAAAFAQAAQTPTVTVSGQGTVTRAPDQATLALEIVTNNDAAAVATSQNNAAYNALRARLTVLGIHEGALRTRAFTVSFVPKPADTATYKPPRTGYIVTRSLEVTIDDLGNVGRAIDAAVGAGVSGIGGVAFGLRDRRGAYAEALAAAMRDAESQAAALATAAHSRLGGVRSISASGFVPVPPVPLFARAAAAAPNVPTEVQPSDVEVRASVNVTYAIGR